MSTEEKITGSTHQSNLNLPIGETTIEWAWRELGIEEIEREKLKKISPAQWLDVFDRQMQLTITLTHKLKKLKRALKEIAESEAVTIMGKPNPLAEEFINHHFEPIKRKAQEALDSIEPLKL